ncbi:MAG: hypothetical protein SGBAC_007572 [Bacillariaceae sp.]
MVTIQNGQEMSAITNPSSVSVQGSITIAVNVDQTCPTLAVRAEQEWRSSREGRDYSGVSMILIAVAVAILAGICLTLWNYFEDRHRKSMLVQSDKTKNLRAYRDQDDVDDGVFNDRSYR